ncbi:LysR substrate-binding domain-containing protein [Conexibacter woesei]|uniref:LysR substrate-binding domain-containing protein n=1 Tax=Conexibacter woesei TaxID=191495 RepID=UPI0006854AC3|nr:LysR substrate-binding domain-containing protein [Conexibacter woesei]
MLNLRQLECFVTAADAGTMTAAATRLYVSQSAISLAVGQLERSLGTQLFIREKARGLRLTAAGRRLLPEARSLLAHAEDVRTAGEEAGVGLRGSLTVGCFRTAAPFVLPELLETFASEQPDVALDFIEGPSDELADALLEGRCEIALLYDQGLRPGIATELVRTMRPYALMSPEHPLARRASVAVAEIAPHPMIMLDVPPSKDYYNDLFRLAGVEPNVRHYASSYELVRALVGRDLGWAPLLSRPQVDRSYEGRPLVQVPFDDEPLANQLVLAWPDGIRLTRRARAFAELCRRVVSDPPSSPAAAARPGGSPYRS